MTASAPVTVTRTNVGPRVILARLVDGERAVAEGVEYSASCGCVVTFGIRIDNAEKSCRFGLCDRHRPHGGLIVPAFVSDDAPPIGTDQWLGQVLTRCDLGGLS